MEKEIIGKFFGSGKSKNGNEKNWVAIENGEGRVFFNYWGEIPLEIKKLKRGEEVKVIYEEKIARKGERTFINRMLKSIEPTQAKSEVNEGDKYKRYRAYQHQLLQECYEDAKEITNEEEEAKEIALALFEKRCTPLAYFQ